MARIAAGLLLVSALTVLAAGCSHRDSALVRLDGSPRVAGDEGIATTLTRDKVVLDGQRTYSVDARFISFSTYTGALEPMVSRLGQYVQLGLRRGAATWMAGLAAVVPGHPPSVYYVGRLRRVDGRHRAVFADGTVLRLAAGITAPSGTARLRARIDAERHIVVELMQG